MALQIASSFRDPSGSVYTHDDQIIRSINLSYAEDYGFLHQSGLLQALWEKKWLIPFEECDVSLIEGAWKALRVEKIPFISYPYEWSFSQLQAAALLTLNIQEQALQQGMTLKDASAYNVQFRGATPVFIDCLSFARHQDGQPWIAYGQFCQHFLAPLFLMAKTDISLNRLLENFIDGIPLPLASKLLPFRTQFSFGAQLHLHMHAKMQKRHSDTRQSAQKARRVRISTKSLLALVQSLRNVVQALRLPKVSTTWGDYYQNTNYSEASFLNKKRLVEDFLRKAGGSSVLDLGANTGVFSAIAAQSSQLVLSVDMDASAVHQHHQLLINNNTANILPLIVDLSNPSASIGWANEERHSFIERCKVDTILALAVIHHISIGNNVPLSRSAQLFAAMGNTLVIEFVPKEDSQVERMLSTREDIFPNYTLDGFLEAYSTYFFCVKQTPIEGSRRTLLILKRKA